MTTRRLAVIPLLLLGTSAFSQWSASPSGPQNKVGTLAAGPSGEIYSGGDDGVMVSRDNGATWTVLDASLKDVWGVSGNGDLWAGNGYKEVRSADGGSHWSTPFTVTDYATDPEFSSFAFKNNFVLAATSTHSLSYASDYGMKTPFVNRATGSQQPPEFIGFDNNGTAYAASATQIDTSSRYSGDLIFWSTIPNSAFGGGTKMAFNKKGEMIAGGTNGLFYSSDRGANWTSLDGGKSANIVIALGPNGYIFEGFNTGASGIKLKRSVSDNWQDLSSGLKSTQVYAVAQSRDGHVFIGTDSGVFVYSETTGDVEPEGNSALTFALEQNHPNPVSRLSTIHFSLPEAVAVTLKVYDFSGREVASLANGQFAAGPHDVTFDSRGLAAGAYYYELHAGTNSAGRMLIVAP